MKYVIIIDEETYNELPLGIQKAVSDETIVGDIICVGVGTHVGKIIKSISYVEGDYIDLLSVNASTTTIIHDKWHELLELKK